MNRNKYILQLLCTVVAIITFAGCSNNSHTTVITPIPPPPQQVLSVVSKPVPRTPVPPALDTTADPRKPLILFHLQNGKSFRVGEEVPIEFSVLNAKLKADGGEFRVRYIVDDDEMQWLDRTEAFWLAGWIPGNHTIRIELIGPDGWPYKNGEANIVTKEITIH
jgi:hypothetical protein